MTPASGGEGGLLERAHDRFGQGGVAVYSGVLCFVTLGLAGLVGLVTREPYVFPSLGPSVMLFFEAPRAPSSSTKNTIVGHLVGIGVGAACLHTFGLAGLPPATQAVLTGGRVLAAAASVAVTALVLRLIRCPHPPAGASTLIVSLGLLTSSKELGIMVLAVFLVAMLALGINHLLGVHQPVVTEEET